MKSIGTVTTYNAERGFGFILPDGLEYGYNNAVFFHCSSLPNRGMSPKKGSRWEFRLKETGKGKAAYDMVSVDEDYEIEEWAQGSSNG